MSTNHPRQRRCRLLWRPSQKFTEIVERFFLFKQRKVPFVFSTSLIHSFSFYDVLWSTMWLCRWWCFVCTVSLTAFWCVFLPTFGSFSLQTCLLSWRLICPAIVPETRTAHRQWRKWLREMAGRCSEFNGKKPETLQKPDFCKSYSRLVSRENWEFKSLDDTAPPRLIWDGLHWDQHLNFGFSSFINHQIQPDALHRTRQIFQFVSDWQNEIWTDFCHFDILCDIFPTYSQHVPNIFQHAQHPHVWFW